MGAIVEAHHDEHGIIWPREAAPFNVHLIEIGMESEADKIYSKLIAEGQEVLYDDRADKSAGEKFADADLIGAPLRVVVSTKTIKSDSVEIKKRNSNKVELIKISKLYSNV